MPAKYGGRHQIGNLRGFIAAGLDRMQGFESNFLPLLRFRVLIPLRYAGIEVPAVIVNALTLCFEIGQQLPYSGQIVTFKVSQPDDDVGNLDPGVIDVVLHIDSLTGGAEQANKSVTQDGIAQMADVGGLVGIDAGVLDQGMKMALLLRNIVADDLLHRSLAVKLAIDISGAGDGEGRKTLQRQQVLDQLPGNRARRSLKTAGQLESYRQRVLTHLQIGRLLDGDLRELNLIFGLKNRAEPLAKKSLLFAIHAKSLIFLPILAEGPPC